MIRCSLRPEGLQQQQPQRRPWQQQQELRPQEQQHLEQPQQHNQQQQQLQQHNLEPLQIDSHDASPAARRLSAAAAASPVSHSGHSEWVASVAEPPCAAAANSSSSSSSALGVTIAAIGNEMMRRLEEDCEVAARGARHRAEEFASFVDEQMAQLEELAMESARLQAEVEDLHASEHQAQTNAFFFLCWCEFAQAVDAELASVVAAKEKVELRLQSAERKLQAARRGKWHAPCIPPAEYAVVSRQEAHARREWRARVDLYKFTHGLRLHQLPGQSAPTRICFSGLYKDLPQLECFLDVSLEADSCRVVGAWPEAPLSELAALYAEGRVSFAALLAYSRLLFKRQLAKMTHTQKLVSLHEQQRQRAADHSEGIEVLQRREREALLCDA
ncbi:hypothetical protein Esti_002390 [Eimeria stiedai]